MDGRGGVIKADRDPTLIGWRRERWAESIGGHLTARCRQDKSLAGERHNGRPSGATTPD